MDINLPSDSNICFLFIHSQEDVVEYVSENEKVKKRKKYFMRSWKWEDQHRRKRKRTL